MLRRKPHPSAVLAQMPSTVSPMLPTLARKPFSGQDWLFEPKLDGWRALCFTRDDKVHFISRKGNSLDERFQELLVIAESIKATTAIIDGEVVALDDRGIPWKRAEAWER